MRDEHDRQHRPPRDRHREGRDGGVVVLEAVAHPLGEASGTGLEQALIGRLGLGRLALDDSAARIAHCHDGRTTRSGEGVIPARDRPPRPGRGHGDECARRPCRRPSLAVPRPCVTSRRGARAGPGPRASAPPRTTPEPAPRSGGGHRPRAEHRGRRDHGRCCRLRRARADGAPGSGDRRLRPGDRPVGVGACDGRLDDDHEARHRARWDPGAGAAHDRGRRHRLAPSPPWRGDRLPGSRRRRPEPPVQRHQDPDRPGPPRRRSPGRLLGPFVPLRSHHGGRGVLRGLRAGARAPPAPVGRRPGSRPAPWAWRSPSAVRGCCWASTGSPTCSVAWPSGGRGSRCARWPSAAVCCASVPPSRWWRAAPRRWRTPSDVSPA